jgi:hypothetical protein
MSNLTTARSIRSDLSRLKSIPESDLTDVEFQQWSELSNRWANHPLRKYEPEELLPLEIYCVVEIMFILRDLEPRMIAFAKRKDDEEAEAEDDTLDVYQQGLFSEFSCEAFSDYHDCWYFQCWGGGPEGGFLHRTLPDGTEQTFRVNRGWFERWSIEPITQRIDILNNNQIRLIE